METIVGGGPRRVIPARPVFRSLHLKPEEPKKATAFFASEPN